MMIFRPRRARAVALYCDVRLLEKDSSFRCEPFLALKYYSHLQSQIELLEVPLTQSDHFWQTSVYIDNLNISLSYFDNRPHNAAEFESNLKQKLLTYLNEFLTSIEVDNTKVSGRLPDIHLDIPDIDADSFQSAPETYFKKSIVPILKKSIESWASQSLLPSNKTVTLVDMNTAVSRFMSYLLGNHNLNVQEFTDLLLYLGGNKKISTQAKEDFIQILSISSSYKRMLDMIDLSGYSQTIIEYISTLFPSYVSTVVAKRVKDKKSLAFLSLAKEFIGRNESHQDKKVWLFKVHILTSLMSAYEHENKPITLNMINQIRAIQQPALLLASRVESWCAIAKVQGISIAHEKYLSTTLKNQTGSDEDASQNDLPDYRSKSAHKWGLNQLVDMLKNVYGLLQTPWSELSLKEFKYFYQVLNSCSNWNYQISTSIALEIAQVYVPSSTNFKMVNMILESALMSGKNEDLSSDVEKKLSDCLLRLTELPFELYLLISTNLAHIRQLPLERKSKEILALQDQVFEIQSQVSTSIDCDYKNNPEIVQIWQMIVKGANSIRNDEADHVTIIYKVIASLIDFTLDEVGKNLFNRWVENNDISSFQQYISNIPISSEKPRMQFYAEPQDKPTGKIIASLKLSIDRVCKKASLKVTEDLQELLILLNGVGGVVNRISLQSIYEKLSELEAKQAFLDGADKVYTNHRNINSKQYEKGNSNSTIVESILQQLMLNASKKTLNGIESNMLQKIFGFNDDCLETPKLLGAATAHHLQKEKLLNAAIANTISDLVGRIKRERNGSLKQLMAVMVCEYIISQHYLNRFDFDQSLELGESLAKSCTYLIESLRPVNNGQNAKEIECIIGELKSLSKKPICQNTSSHYRPKWHDYISTFSACINLYKSLWFSDQTLQKIKVDNGFKRLSHSWEWVSNYLGQTGNCFGRISESHAFKQEINSLECQINRLSELDRATDVTVNDGGLILLWPFYSTLFKKLNLINQSNQWHSLSATYKARRLLLYISGVQQDRNQSTLIGMETEVIAYMANLIVGIPICDEIDDNQIINADEKQACDELLTTAIIKWKQLKKMKPTTFRSMFLQRSAQVNEKSECTLIVFDNQPQDVLLSTLDWGLGIVQFPWMNKKLIDIKWH